MRSVGRCNGLSFLLIGPVLLSSLSFSGQASAETFDSNDIIALTKAKVGNEALIAKIETQSCGSDMSYFQIARLKKAGVSNRVLAAVIRRCKDAPTSLVRDGRTSVRTPGVYIQSQSDTRRIEPAYVAAGRSGGNGSLLFPSRSKLSLLGRSGQVSVPVKPYAFYFQLVPANAHTDGFGNGFSDGARHPRGFNLVKFDVRSDRREIVVENATKISARTGIADRLSIAFLASEIADDAFKIELPAGLEPGQYAFIERLNGETYRVYDFEVP